MHPGPAQNEHSARWGPLAIHKLTATLVKLIAHSEKILGEHERSQWSRPVLIFPSVVSEKA